MERLSDPKREAPITNGSSFKTNRRYKTKTHAVDIGEKRRKQKSENIANKNKNPETKSRREEVSHRRSAHIRSIWTVPRYFVKNINFDIYDWISKSKSIAPHTIPIRTRTSIWAEGKHTEHGKTREGTSIEIQHTICRRDIGMKYGF